MSLSFSNLSASNFQTCVNLTLNTDPSAFQFRVYLSSGYFCYFSTSIKPFYYTIDLNANDTSAFLSGIYYLFMNLSLFDE